MLGRWGSCWTVMFWNPLAAVTQSPFLLCLSPLQVMAPPQPSLKGQEPGQPLPLNPMGVEAPILHSLPELSPPLECRLDPVTLLKRDEMSFT